MCLLITGSANEIRNTLLNTEGLIYDIFKSNPDGLGAMYATSRAVLKTPKILPKTVTECIAFIKQLPDDDREMALHWRWKTHGDVNLENCHPYPVIDGIAMMHNGVLSQGNNRDKSKSDTWHYIKDIVAPLLEAAPHMMLNSAVIELLENDIGSGNKFAIMNAEGDLVVLNKQAGLKVNGMWFSNTYAWSPEILLPEYKKPYSYRKGGYNFGLQDDDWTDYNIRSIPTKPKAQVKSLPAPATTVAAAVMHPEDFGFDADELWQAVSAGDVPEVADHLLDFPITTLFTLFNECEFVSNDKASLGYSADDQEVIDLLKDEDIKGIRELIGGSLNAATCVAQVICWYGDWVGKAADKKDPAALNEKAFGELAQFAEDKGVDLNEVDEHAEMALPVAGVKSWTEAEIAEAVEVAMANAMTNDAVVDEGTGEVYAG